MNIKYRTKTLSEEEIDEIVERMKMFGSDGASLLMVDTQLAARVLPAEEQA